MMQRSGRYAWVAGDGFKSIVLPYAGVIQAKKLHCHLIDGGLVATGC